ncbi:hypothetical protein DFP72DRAFT_505392 [Ephemerocybe angulata]|uniref:G domain-containing protein n=1 Tax=Ephemerocybe angulata TaxID=980116 RepID=A0A8H6HQG9_9AGAR|nr:hypothetical protein DFP72DRAFT_505392 [Tulosesus angulatus]
MQDMALGASDSKSGDTLVAVIGHAGSGKSSLINAIVGKDVAKIGSEYGSCTVDVAEYPYTLPNGHKLIFVDTPGFDGYVSGGTTPSTTDILEMIEKVASTRAVSFSYFIIVQSMRDDDTMSDLKEGLPKRTFERIAGDAKFAILTTHWDLIYADEGEELDEVKALEEESRLSGEGTFLDYLCTKYGESVSFHRSGMPLPGGDPVPKYTTPKGLIYQLFDVLQSPKSETTNRKSLSSLAPLVIQPNQTAPLEQPKKLSSDDGGTDDLARKLEARMKQLEGITSKLIEHHTFIETLRASSDDSFLKEEYTKLSEELNGVRAEKDRLARELTEAHASSAHTATILQRLAAQRDNLIFHKQGLETELETARGDYATLFAERDGLLAGNRELEGKLGDAVSAAQGHSSELETTRRECEALRSHDQQVTHDLLEANNELKRYRNLAEDWKAERAKLETGLEELRAGKEKVEVVVRQVEKEVVDLKGERDGLVEKASKLTEQLRSVSGELEKTKKEKTGLLSINKKLTREVADQRREQASLKAKTGELERKSNDLEGKKRELETAKEEAEKLKQEQMAANTPALRARIDKLSNDLTTANTRRITAESELKKAQEEIVRLKGESEAAKRRAREEELLRAPTPGQAPRPGSRAAFGPGPRSSPQQRRGYDQMAPQSAPYPPPNTGPPPSHGTMSPLSVSMGLGGIGFGLGLGTPPPENSNGGYGDQTPTAGGAPQPYGQGSNVAPPTPYYPGSNPYGFSDSATPYPPPEPSTPWSVLGGASMFMPTPVHYPPIHPSD